jgi:predicted transcriptional regulator
VEPSTQTINEPNWVIGTRGLNPRLPLQYHVCDTLLAVEKAISIRLDDEAQRALGALTATGRKQSEVVREALIELARRQDRVSLVAEVERLNADPRDRAEKTHVARLMEALRAKG